MTLAHLGEFGLITRLQAILPTHAKNAMGIGDDCAVIPKDNHSSWLVTTDMLIDKIHFLSDHIPPYALGHKALAVSLSDIAAMGGAPRFVFLSMALPKTTTVKWIDDYLRGMGELAHVHNVIVLGGDTTKSDRDIALNVLVMGDANNDKIKLRSAAKPNDIICVTGYLGDSGAGLDAILKKRDLDDTTRALINNHYFPRPHLREGQWLAAQRGVHAMMDVSDGIASDLKHIATQSGCGATIELLDLPRSTLLRDYCTQYDLNCRQLASSAGEDYCLLATIAPQHFVQINSDYTALFGRPLYAIGHMTDNHADIRFTEEQNPVSLFVGGFDHFKSG